MGGISFSAEVVFSQPDASGYDVVRRLGLSMLSAQPLRRAIQPGEIKVNREPWLAVETGCRQALVGPKWKVRQ